MVTFWYSVPQKVLCPMPGPSVSQLEAAVVAGSMVIMAALVRGVIAGRQRRRSRL